MPRRQRQDEMIAVERFHGWQKGWEMTKLSTPDFVEYRVATLTNVINM
jgi:hypothetical protein